MGLEQRAKEFAIKAHAGQVRKYTGEPYINHPAAVVEIVRSVPHTDTMIAAAWLHDVVEDCDVTIKQIFDLFGHDVAKVVEGLTDKSKPSDGNRKTRKQIDRDKLAKCCADVQTIKLADLIDNTHSIIKYDKDFAVVYLREKRELLGVLTRGDESLMTIARHYVGENN